VLPLATVVAKLKVKELDPLPAIVKLSALLSCKVRLRPKPSPLTVPPMVASLPLPPQATKDRIDAAQVRNRVALGWLMMALSVDVWGGSYGSLAKSLSAQAVWHALAIRAQ
jgi:hypothetical protein